MYTCAYVTRDWVLGHMFLGSWPFMQRVEIKAHNDYQTAWSVYSKKMMVQIKI
jgi:hypothetical protein